MAEAASLECVSFATQKSGSQKVKHVFVDRAAIEISKFFSFPFAAWSNLAVAEGRRIYSFQDTYGHYVEKKSKKSQRTTYMLLVAYGKYGR